MYGPGSSARGSVAVELRHASSSASTLAATSAVGCVRVASLQLVERARGALRRATPRARRPCRSAAAPAGLPRARRSRLGIHRASTIRSRPGEVTRDPDARRIRRSRARRQRPRAPSCTSRTSQPSSTARVARRAARSGPRRRARRAAPSRAPRARARRARRRSTYGGFETTRSNGPSRPSSRSASTSSTSSAVRRCVLARERQRVAPRRRSRSRARPGRSCFSASAIAPVPVPTSSDRAARSIAVEQREAALDDDLGLGPRHERARIGLQRQPAEVPVAEHVRERLTRAAALHELARCCALGLGQRPVVLRVELDALQAERACEQAARRRDARVSTPRAAR